MRGIQYGKKFTKLEQTRTDRFCTNGHLCTLTRGLAWACAIGFGASASGCVGQYLQRMARKPSLGGRCWVCFFWLQMDENWKYDWWGNTLILNHTILTSRGPKMSCSQYILINYCMFKILLSSMVCICAHSHHAFQINDQFHVTAWCNLCAFLRPPFHPCFIRLFETCSDLHFFVWCKSIVWPTYDDVIELTVWQPQSEKTRKLHKTVCTKSKLPA